MALGTLDRTPPPFFRQGTSALTKVSVFAALAIFLMVADSRFRFAQPLRATIANVLYPVQRALLWPVDAVAGGRDWFTGLAAAREGEAAARRELAGHATRAVAAEQLGEENRRLRLLLELKPQLTVRAQAAELLYETGDPYSRKVVIDRGSSHGLVAGSPVVNEAGVLGQVTRVYLQSSEVTLLTDRDAAIPVLNQRTGKRAAAFGSGGALANLLELRFVAGNADVQVGDLLTTSGVDGVYPPGLPVAKVSAIDRKADSGFARIALAPLASADGVRHVLVLEPTGEQLPGRPEAAASQATAAAASRPAAARTTGPRR